MGGCGSDHRNHPALARKLQGYLRWRNAHARHPDVLAAQRRERALAVMLARYLRYSETGLPVHTWPVAN